MIHHSSTPQAGYRFSVSVKEKSSGENISLFSTVSNNKAMKAAESISNLLNVPIGESTSIDKTEVANILHKSKEIINHIEIDENKFLKGRHPFVRGKNDLRMFLMSETLSIAISLFMNNYDREKGLSGLKFIFSSKKDGPAEEEKEVSNIKSAGWKDEEEIYIALSAINDARAFNMQNTAKLFSEDLFDRYYLGLKDELIAHSGIYNLRLLDYLDRMITESKKRKKYYNENPDDLEALREQFNFTFKGYVRNVMGAMESRELKAFTAPLKFVKIFVLFMLFIGTTVSIYSAIKTKNYIAPAPLFIIWAIIFFAKNLKKKFLKSSAVKKTATLQ